MSSQSSRYHDIHIERVTPSGISFVYYNVYNRYYQDAESGVYTCRFPNSDGSVVDVSIGIHLQYSTGMCIIIDKSNSIFSLNLQISHSDADPSAPSIYSSTYQDFSSHPNHSVLAEFNCKSNNSMPTKVTWLRNGQMVNTDDSADEIVQSLDTRSDAREGYYYDNILRVRDITGVYGHFTYTCIVENSFGMVNQSILFDRTGIDDMKRVY